MQFQLTSLVQLHSIPGVISVTRHRVGNPVERVKTLVGTSNYEKLHCDYLSDQIYEIHPQLAASRPTSVCMP